VQALRYEAADDSQLSRFVVGRAATNRVLGILLHWYLYTEFQDPAFGPRAAKVHEAFQAAAAAAGHVRCPCTLV
jgi:phosphatidylinositol 3-kinase